MTTTTQTAADMKAKLFAKMGQYTEERELVAAISELNLPKIGTGLTGGTGGTAQRYTDHKWGKNVIRLCGRGFEDQKPSCEVIE